MGAAYAWQVIAPQDGQQGAIRAVVGPGVTVSVAEPVPYRLRSHDGGPTESRKPGNASAGAGLATESFEFTLVEVADPAKVPVQGTPLNIEYLLGFGSIREPDQHSWLNTDDASVRMATGTFDAVVSMIPIVGALYTIGEFAYTAATGHDWWGNEVDDGGKVLMGVGAVLSIIPLVGGVSRLITGAVEMTRVVEFAAQWGMRAEELETVLARVATSVSGSDAEVVAKATRARQKGGSLTEEEMASLRSVLGEVGAAGVAFEGIALSGTGRLEVELTSGGSQLTSQDFLAQLLSDVRTTGKVSDELMAPLARSGQFGNAEETEAAVQQALRDLAGSEGVAADEALVNATAHSAGEAVARVQAAAAEVSMPQTRVLAVSRPELIAQYEQLVNERLSATIQNVLQGQGTTPPRTRLAQIRTQFDQLRNQFGPTGRLTPVQRDLANQLLREARTLSEGDFDLVRAGVWRRLRNPRLNPDLARIERQLLASGDAQVGKSGGLNLRMAEVSPTGQRGGTKYESMNLEHRVRRSDNPWAYRHARPMRS